MDHNMYYYSMCHLCKKMSQDLKVCASCKSVSYCSKQHQIEDWQNHKAICKVIKKSKPHYDISKLSWEDWVIHRTQVRRQWEKLLNRRLHLYENQMWMFPKVCAVCFSSVCQVGCQFCFNVSYCNLEHQQEHYELHKEFCKPLRICMEVDHYLITNNYRPTIKSFDIDQTLDQLPKDISELMKFVQVKLRPSVSNETVEFIRSADFIAPIATFIYALEQISVIKERSIGKSDITVHIIGAGILEEYLDWVVYLEFICHWLSDLKALKIFLIGPELTQPQIGVVNIADAFCKNCHAREIEAQLEFHTKFYHNIHKQLSRPDFMLLYNSGLHEFQNTDDDTWKNTLPVLMNSEAPLILTSYTFNEMLRDLNRLQSVDERAVVVGPEKNPFRCCRPYRDWETHNQPVFYDNAWLSIINK